MNFIFLFFFQFLLVLFIFQLVFYLLFIVVKNHFPIGRNIGIDCLHFGQHFGLIREEYFDRGLVESKIFNFIEESDIVQHLFRPFDLRVTEGGTVFKIAKLFQEFGNLNDNMEHIFRGGVIGLN